MNVWHSISANSRIIVIHPNYNKPRFLLSTLLDADNTQYRCLSAQLTEADFIFEEAPDFLILDEFDLLSEAEATDLLDTTLSNYPDTRLILFSRHLPDLQSQHRSIACLFPIDEDMGLVDYFKVSRLIVELFGFGVGAVAVNGKRKPVWQIDVHPLMIFYLMEKGPTSRETLLKEFWPEKKGQAAVRALHYMRARLHEILGVEAIVFVSSLYQINPELEILYDVQMYRSLIEKAYNASQGLNLAHFAQAYDAYTGEYLLGRKEAWIVGTRTSLQELLAEGDYRLAQILQNYGENDKAAAWYSFAFQLNSARDDVIYALMKLFLDLNLPCQALHFYCRFEENLREKHGISPSQRLVALYQRAKSAC